MQPPELHSLQGSEGVPGRAASCPKSVRGFKKTPFLNDRGQPRVKNYTKGAYLRFHDFLGFDFENWVHVASAWH